jgi:hypothetical protein
MLSAFGAHTTTYENNTSSVLMLTPQAGMLWAGTGLKGCGATAKYLGY